MNDSNVTWRKSRASGSTSNCVEVSNNLEQLRDSKNQSGPQLTVDVRALVEAVKDGQIG